MSNAYEYADRYARDIRAAVDAGHPFGFIDDSTDTTAETLDELRDFLSEDEAPDGYLDADHLPGDWRKANASDYLQGALSIRYTVSGRGASDYISADIAIAIGGPNIWIDTAKGTLTVYWGGEPEVRNLPYSFCEELDEAAGELWGMGE